ncbi:porin family protein [Dyadobacter sp. 676]|uniref:Porin family protein n=1 Tax=Dyadobacter sp. 676 TaxID=3088362 RepID=A0AAU8FK70_9BACT
MLIKLPYILALASLLALPAGSAAQTDDKLTFHARAGVAVGGATPIGMPASIRKIESYDPGFLPSLEAGLGYRFSRKFGVAAAIRFEQKGMTTEARVKGYYTTFNEGSNGDHDSVTGYFTGDVETKVRNRYLTVPLHLTYQPAGRFVLKAGGFVSLSVSKRFTGSARDGYLRNETPVGEREDIDVASYDFSGNVRRIDAGAEIGADCHFASRLYASANLSYALTPLMERHFKSIGFGLHNIYLNLGIGYRFH